MRRAACIALTVLAVVAAPAAAARLPLVGLKLDICETYGHDACLEHADRCTPCLAWGKVNTCFETSIAKRLPPKLFECDFAPPAPPPSPSPTTDCGSLSEEGACEEAHCVWCMSAAVPSACYTEAEAKRLPDAVFQCKFPSLLSEQQLASWGGRLPSEQQAAPRQGCSHGDREAVRNEAANPCVAG